MSEENNEVAVVESGKAVTKFTAQHAAEFGLPSPEAINFMVATAKLILKSSLITGDMGNNPEMIQANAIAKMMVGHQLGIQGIQAMQEIDIVKGRIFIRYPQLIAQMMKKGFRLKWEERTIKAAKLRVTPPAEYLMDEEVFEYSMEDAQRSGTANNDNYKRQPRVMLAARVVSEAFRMTGGASNIFTPEEKIDMSDLYEPEPQQMDPEQRREARAQVLDTKLAEFKKPATATPVEPVIVEEDSEDRVDADQEDAEAEREEEREAENPTLFDAAPEEPPTWAVDVRRIHDKLLEAGRTAVIRDAFKKVGAASIEEVTEETAISVIADWEDNLAARPIQPKPAAKGKLKL